jgi:hypothetical protein
MIWLSSDEKVLVFGSFSSIGAHGLLALWTFVPGELLSGVPVDLLGSPVLSELLLLS